MFSKTKGKKITSQYHKQNKKNPNKSKIFSL